ncbi:5'-3' exonuclease H3TH domain-containing protein [Nocardioides sp.]|uniref:5'-3' exonuclease n=1 Tax=Nocardioides sp. TaxID=35761 RepID=UPI00286C8248|nr:5'-3' exonuclease H3TH domain-containing protein [Nocardioides sp.]
MTTRTVLAVDGNSLLHRAFHASARSGFRTPDGRPAWAVRGLLAQLLAAVDRACADAVVVGFDDRLSSIRRERWPVYKAHRLPKPDTLHEQLDRAVEVLRELGVAVVVPTGLEADDVLASVAAQAPATGARTVIVTSDRDSFSLVDEHTRLLRILNGGVDASPLLDPARLRMVAGVCPDQYLDLAALRGDASDNLPGVRGFGAKTAARLLHELGTAADAFADAAAGGERCTAAVGAARARTLATDEAREQWQLNREVMTMVRTVDLGLTTTPGTLPLDEQAIGPVFARHGLDASGAVRALTLREPTGPRAPSYVDPRWRPAPVQRFAPLRPATPPAAAAPEPASVQETLF